MDVEPDTTPTPPPPAPGTDSELDAAMKEVSKNPEEVLKKLQGDMEGKK
jgi:hypothetical protein